MARCIQKKQTKGSWVLIICVFASSVYVVLKMDEVMYTKPFSSIRLLGRKMSVIEDRHIRDRVYNNSTSSTGGSNINNMFSNTTDKSKQNAFPLNISVANSDSVQFNKSAIKVGILIPSSTKRIKNPLLEHLSLVKICIPSIYKTIEEEYTYIIYVGIDKGDYLETVKDKLETTFDKVKTVVTRGGTFTRTVNAIAREAYQDGMDYLVRINDDSSFETRNWTSVGISSLLHYTPLNVGVVGPTCHEGNTHILTHDMVHRTHLEIFDFYYPPYFDNWWADDWITEVYKPKCLQGRYSGELHTSNRKSAVSEKTVYKWIRKFKNGQAVLKERSRAGRPRTAVTSKNTAAIRGAINKEISHTVSKINGENSRDSPQSFEFNKDSCPMGANRVECAKEMLKKFSDLDDLTMSQILTTDD